MTPGLRIILDYRPALRQRTGVGEYVHELTRALSSLAAGSGDTVVAFSSSWKDRLRRAQLAGVEAVDVRIPVRLLNLAWHRLEWPPIERLTGPADIAHSAHPLLMPARAAAQVVTIHDLDFLEHPERTGREIRRDYPRLVRDHATRADLVVVSSRHTARQVGAVLGVDEHRIVLCPAGAPDWTPRGEATRGNYFLFVGTFEPRKNLACLLDAYEQFLSRHPDAPSLRLAGRPTAESNAWLARVTRAPLAGHVAPLGYVPDAAKRDLYAGAVALLIPSLYEGFGLTALEAMTVGLPVVASDRGALPELLGDAGLYVDPEDASSIAHAMERIWLDHAAADALAASGRRRARTFSWKSSAAVLLEAYRDALARRRGQA